MLTEHLQKILAIEEKERAFYVEQLKPALYRLEHAEDLQAEREKIARLVAGTIFEETLESLEDLDEVPEHLYKLTHLFPEQMHDHHMKRQSEVESLLQVSAQQPDLPAIAWYYLACIYSKGDTEQDCQRADEYLHQALDRGLSTQQHELLPKIRELLAQNYDRWQLRKTPPQPQKYGTIYADHHDVLKGLEKDQLVRPYPGYQYQIEAIDQARQALGLQTLAEHKKNL